MEEQIPHHTPQPFIPKPEVIEKIIETPVEVEKVIEKNVYGEEVEKKLELLEHPRIKDAIKHAKRAGEL